MRILLLSLLLLPCLTGAATSDRQQPAYLSADAATLNYKTHVGIYTGHVILRQGTTLIVADQLTTYFDDNRQLQRAIATGKPARYTTLPDNSRLPFTAVGTTINYDALQGFVELIGQARTTQGKDSLAGPHLKYTMTQQTVVSLAAKAGHTTIIIQPDQKLSA